MEGYISTTRLSTRSDQIEELKRLSRLNTKIKSPPNRLGVTNLKLLHTKAVTEEIANKDANRVLEEKPSQIRTEEELLPRATRATLAQTRSGY